MFDSVSYVYWCRGKGWGRGAPWRYLKIEAGIFRCAEELLAKPFPDSYFLPRVCTYDVDIANVRHTA